MSVNICIRYLSHHTHLFIQRPIPIFPFAPLPSNRCTNPWLAFSLAALPVPCLEMPLRTRPHSLIKQCRSDFIRRVVKWVQCGLLCGVNSCIDKGNRRYDRVAEGKFQGMRRTKGNAIQNSSETSRLRGIRNLKSGKGTDLDVMFPNVHEE
jgi:hypothetical protein